MLCSSCGRENSAEARFCSACGAALAPSPLADAMRKTVTVVFTDLAGSTALGERLDPESVRQVVSRYFDTVRRVLERHGGTVEKFIGDAVMAVFGVPVVQEDDALRAVRAAAEVHEAIERLSDAVAHERGVRIATRTGVNTGEVVVGGADAADDQRLATGDAVNVAARLEQAAAPGEVLLGHETYRAVRDAVVAEEREPIAAKGKSERVRAWRLVAVRPDVPAFARPIRTPFVGRTTELNALERAFETAVAERACALATMIGTPGIGKSRLAREFLRSIESEARVLIGRCVAYGRGTTYLPLAEIVREVAGDDPQPRLAELLAGTGRGEAAARLVAAAVGAGDEAVSAEESAWAFRRVLEALAARRPLVVVLDDIHWAEPALLDLLEYLTGFSSGAPILILCLARPDLFDARPSWAAPQPRSTIVALNPLDSAEAERLVERLLDEQRLPPALRRRILATAPPSPATTDFGSITCSSATLPTGRSRRSRAPTCTCASARGSAAPTTCRDMTRSSDTTSSRPTGIGPTSGGTTRRRVRSENGPASSWQPPADAPLYRTRIAHVLIARDQDADALAELEHAQPIAESSPVWKTARARLLARRGDTAAAATLARDAALSVPRDDLTTRADVLTDVALVLRADGDVAGATAALDQAAALHELKGNLLPAERCRALRGEVSGTPDGEGAVVTGDLPLAHGG